MKKGKVEKKERTEFCTNCRHHTLRVKTPSRCIKCFGVNLNGTLYCYKNWEAIKEKRGGK